MKMNKLQRCLRSKFPFRFIKLGEEVHEFYFYTHFSSHDVLLRITERSKRQINGKYVLVKRFQ